MAHFKFFNLKTNRTCAQHLLSLSHSIQMMLRVLNWTLKILIIYWNLIKVGESDDDDDEEEAEAEERKDVMRDGLDESQWENERISKEQVNRRWFWKEIKRSIMVNVELVIILLKTEHGWIWIYMANLLLCSSNKGKHCLCVLHISVSEWSFGKWNLPNSAM